MKRKQRITPLQAAVTQLYQIKLCKFQFPKQNQMNQYLVHDNAEQKDIFKIKQFFKKKMAQQYPQFPCSFLHHCYNRKQGIIQYRLQCHQVFLKNKSICRALFQYQYHVDQKYFKLVWYRNDHAHFPAKLERSTIEQIYKNKRRLQSFAKQCLLFEPAEQNVQYQKWKLKNLESDKIDNFQPSMITSYRQEFAKQKRQHQKKQRDQLKTKIMQKWKQRDQLKCLKNPQQQHQQLQQLEKLFNKQSK